MPIVPDGHDVGNNTSGDAWALRGLSSGGHFDQALYIRPEGFGGGDLDETNGELAMEWSFTDDSIAEGEWQIDEIETHYGETMFVSHWREAPDCPDADPPPGFEYPGL